MHPISEMDSSLAVMFASAQRATVAPDAPAPLVAHLDDPRCGKLVGAECMLAECAELDRPDLTR